MLAAAVFTDLPDYAPGATAYITATGYPLGEQIEFQVLHNDGTPNTGGGHEPWVVTDGGSGDLDGIVDGNVTTSWYVNPDDSAYSSFDLTAKGLSSGLTASTTFTDAVQTDYQGWENLDISWSNGAMNAGEGLYLEGDVVPHAVKYNGLTIGQSYTFNISYNFFQPSSNSGGFIAINSYNFSILPSLLFPAGSGGPLLDPTPMPDTGGVFYISDNGGNGIDVDVTNVTASAPISATEKQATVTFTALGTSATFYYGLRLAVPGEVTPGTNGADGFTGLSLQSSVENGPTGDPIGGGGNVQLAPGAVVQGSISGVKWNDLDGQGDKDASEPGLAGWTIQLYRDDGDGVFEPGAGDLLVDTKITADGTTDANGDGAINSLDLGFYKFAPVLRGVYFVQEVQQAGWTQTFPTPIFYGPLTISETTPTHTNKNFGNVLQRGSISWEKHLESGAFQGGATFTVTPNPLTGAGILTIVDNDANDADPDPGQIVINNVLLNTYVVTETVAPTGYALDNDVTRSVTVSAGDLNAVIGAQGTDDLGDTDESDFHNRLGSLAWEKRLESGAFQGGATFTVTPNPLTGAGILTIVDNDANDADPDPGQIVINNVLLNTYVVTETVAPTGYALDNDVTRSVTVSAGDLNAVIGVQGTDDLGDTDESDFHNRLGSLSWEKRLENGAFQGGATFTVTPNPLTGAGVLVIVDNDANDADPDPGQIVINNVLLNTYVITETVAPAGSIIDPNPTRTITVSETDLNAVIGTQGVDDRGTALETDFHNRRIPFVVIAPDKSNYSVPLVITVNNLTGAVVGQFMAYETSFRGGVRLASGDLDGDGIDEIITAPGQGRTAEIQVFKQDGTELTAYRTIAYAAPYDGGVQVAVGDIDGDGDNDIVTTNSRGPTVVKVFFNNPAAVDPISNTPNLQFPVFAPGFLGGADVAVADLGTFSNGVVLDPFTPDGISEIIVASGPGTPAVIQVFDVSGAPALVDIIQPFGGGFLGGVTIDVAPVDGDLIPDLIVSAGNGGTSGVQIWNGLTNDAPDQLISQFNAFADVSSATAPVHAVGVDLDDNGTFESIAAVQGTDGISDQIRNFAAGGVPLAFFAGFPAPWNIVVLHNPLVELPEVEEIEEWENQRRLLQVDSDLMAEVDAAGNLLITGNEAANELRIVPGAAVGEYLLLAGSNGALDDSLINGLSQLTINGVTGKIIVNLGGGDDLISLQGIDNSQGLEINTGEGNDQVTIGEYVSVLVQNSPVLNTMLDGELKIDTGNGHDKIFIGRLYGTADQTIATGAGSDKIEIYNAFAGSVDYNSGSGDDTISVGYLTANDKLIVDAGEGNDLISYYCSRTNSTAEFYGRGGMDTVALDVNKYDADVHADSGDGDDMLLLGRSVLDQNAYLYTGSGNDNALIGKYYAVENGAVVLKNAGSTVKSLTLSLGSGNDKAEMAANILDNFFADLGADQDELFLSYNIINALADLNGGLQSDKLRRVGNSIFNTSVSNFETILNS